MYVVVAGGLLLWSKWRHAQAWIEAELCKSISNETLIKNLAEWRSWICCIFFVWIFLHSILYYGLCLLQHLSGSSVWIISCTPDIQLIFTSQSQSSKTGQGERGEFTNSSINQTIVNWWGHEDLEFCLTHVGGWVTVIKIIQQEVRFKTLKSQMRYFNEIK